MKSKGGKVNWDEEAKNAAVSVMLKESQRIHAAGDAPTLEGPFVAAAKWQRDQLRTDEAVERVARAIAGFDPGEAWPDETIIDDEHRQECFDTARRAIDALIGED